MECHQEATAIVIISHTATVVDVTSHIDKSFPWDFLLLIKEKFEHHERSVKIGVVELVENIPAEGAKLTSFLENSVEERKTEDQLAPLLRLLAVVKVLITHFIETTLQVGFDPSWRLSCQLNTVLEHRDWEVGCRHRCQEQTEVRVDVCALGERHHS